jgi:hypothetical protein
MGIWSNEDDGYRELQRQAKVRCNADATLVNPNGEEFQVRVRELSWYGLVLDRLPPIFIDALSAETDGKLKVKFCLPREFGELEISTDQYSAVNYEDVIGGEKMSLDISLPEGEELENIRQYLYYRNRSFIKNSIRRNRSGLSRYFLMALWGICFILLLIMIGSEITKSVQEWWINWWYAP